jgi:hypothetical protein
MKAILQRVYDLIFKLISVKGFAFIASFVAFSVKPSEYTFYTVVIFGSLLIVGREYGKLLEVLKVIKGK